MAGIEEGDKYYGRRDGLSQWCEVGSEEGDGVRGEKRRLGRGTRGLWGKG